MPVLVINTNVSRAPSNFKTLASEVVANGLEKPVKHVAIQLNLIQDIEFCGSGERLALCELTSAGSLSVEANKRHSDRIMDLLEQHLGIKPTIIYIRFHNMDEADIGFNKTTVDDFVKLDSSG